MHIKNQPGIKPNTEVPGGRTTRQIMVVYLVIKSTNVMPTRIWNRNALVLIQNLFVSWAAIGQQVNIRLWFYDGTLVIIHILESHGVTFRFFLLACIVQSKKKELTIIFSLIFEIFENFNQLSSYDHVSKGLYRVADNWTSSSTVSRDMYTYVLPPTFRVQLKVVYNNPV
jgi:hypothetical protein